MKKRTPKADYDAALAYYKTTVWKFAEKFPLGGVAYAMAFLAYNRMTRLQRVWLDSLKSEKAANHYAAAVIIEATYEPRRLERDDSITPEALATLASARLGVKKPSNINDAIAEAHTILVAARDYLKSLPEPKRDLDRGFEAYHFSEIKFPEILDSQGSDDRLPLLPPVQANRNKGKMTLGAVEKALKQFGKRQEKDVRVEIEKAIENKAISCFLLEKIRWERFSLHFKGR